MPKNITYVIGHKNPDTDSICSAIALAELKRSEGAQNVHAARAGDINPQTAFILEYLKVQPPRYVPDVHTRARDIMETDVVTVAEDTPIQQVMEIMRDEKIRFIPVLDSSAKPIGTLTLMELAKRQVVKAEAEASRDVLTSVKNIAATLKAETVVDLSGGVEKTYSVYVGAMAEESFVRMLGHRDPSSLVVVVGDRTHIQMTSVEKGVGMLIVTGGFQPPAGVIDEAKKRKVSVVVSPYDSATTALLARLSTPASRICDTAFEKACPEDAADDLKYRLSGKNGIIVLDAEGVMQGIITKSSLLKPSRVNLVLVDHNEVSQAVDGADRANIIEVVDHHRIGNFHSPNPITFVCEPVGSTSTLVSEIYKRKGAPIRKEIAGILLGGVLSDTVMLKSPTTTARDSAIVQWLEEKSGLDHMAFGSEIFGATSSLKKRGAAAVVGGDFKVFTAKGKRFGIGQVETIGFVEFEDEKAGLEKELLKMMNEKGLSLSALLVTDIVYGTSLLLAVGEKEIMYRLDYPRLGANVFELKNIISRKKQVVPHVLSLFNEIY